MFYRYCVFSPAPLVCAYSKVPQTVFACRGSKSLVLKGAVEGVMVAMEFAEEHFFIVKNHDL